MWSGRCGAEADICEQANLCQGMSSIFVLVQDALGMNDGRRTKVLLQVVWSISRLWWLCYYIGTLSYRVCFLDAIHFVAADAVFIALDYIADSFFILDSIWLFKSNTIEPGVHIPVQAIPNKPKATNAVSISPRNSDETQVPFHKESRFEMVMSFARIAWEIVSIFPFEVIGYAAGVHNFGYLRLFRLMRVIHISSYWNKLTDILERNKISTNTGIHRLCFVGLVELICCHLAACIFYALAVNLLYRGNINTWLYRDGDVELGPNGEVILLNGVHYRYIRAWYWSAATIAGIGFGDISAWAESETWFVTFYLYLTVLCICSCIVLFSMLVTNYDSAKIENRLKVVRFNKYASYRKLPADLTNRVLSYYEYQWQILRGVDENKILSELPANLSQQVLHLVVRDLLVGVNVLKDLNKALLNALSEAVESYVYSPLDVIVDWNTAVQGVYVISTGEVHKIPNTEDPKGPGLDRAHDKDEETTEEDVTHPTASALLRDPQRTESLLASTRDLLGADGQPKRKSKFNPADPANFLYAGESFGTQALHKTYISTTKYRTKSFAEILLLRGTVFRHMCKLYLRKDELTQLTKSIRSLNKVGEALADGAASLPKPNANTRRKGRNSVMIGNGKKPVLFIEAAVATSDQAWKKHFVPDSPFRIGWDCLMLAVLVFYMVSGALLVQGTVRENFLINYYPLLVVSYFADLVMAVDVVLRATLFGYEHLGLTVTKTSLIWENFCNYENLPLTALAVFPFDLILALAVDFRLIPILRLLKLLHLRRTGPYVENAEDAARQYLGITLSFEVTRFTSLYWYLFLLAHWVSAIWQLTADASVKVFGYKMNWRIFDEHSDFFSINYAALSHTAFYARTFYWALSAMSGIGFPDMLAKNPIEMCVISIVMLFGAIAFGALIGAIATLMGSFGREKREFNAKVSRVQELVKYKNVPAEIESKISRYYEYMWTRYGGVNEAEVLATLPKSLRAVVASHVMGPFLARIPFFRCCSEPMEKVIVAMFSPRVFLHDDALMIFGEVGKEMFIIESGEVKVTSADKKITFATLKAGTYIGESCLLDLTKRTASVYAVNYVDTYFLTSENFLKACEKFPSEYGTIIDAVKAVLEDKLRKNAAITKDAAKSEKIDQAVSAQVQKMNEVALKSIQSIIFSNMMFGNLSFFPDDAHKIHPDSVKKLLWDVLMFAVLVYYAIVIPLRIALNLDPAMFIADYICDVISIIDSYLYFTVFALFSAGQLQTKSPDIQANFKSTRMFIDIVAELPYDLLALCFLGYHGDMFMLIRAALRVPKLLKLLLASNYFKQVERLCKEAHMDPVLFRFTEINFNIIIFSHWVACIFYCFAEFGQRLDDCDHTVRNKYYGYACQYRGTWVMQQIASLKLPLDGGTQWDRYVRAYNWALPNLVVRTMGEVWVMNANEVILAVIMFFFGLSISGMIIGNVMSIVSGASKESTKMFRDIEVLQAYLKANHVPETLVNTAIALLRHQGSTEGALTLNQETILSDLPYSIQLAIDTHVKTLPFLRKCPFFDFYTDEVLREISSKLRVNMYVKDDHVVTYGDLGYEMFFLENGIVHVVSADQKTRYSTLEDGAFFGETAMFFNTIRTATILVASPFCVCLTLRKGDFDAILRNSEFEEEQVLESFKALQMMNQKRNAAVTANLTRAADPTSKLYKLIKLSEKGPATTSYLQQLRQELHPDSTFRAVWDCLGFLLLVYYIFSIPLYAAFLFGTKLDMYLQFMAFDFVIDAYWFVDILLKAYVFSFKLNMFHNRIVTDGEAILANYQKNGYFWHDIVASIPLEMVFITPGIRRITILICRLIHMVRVPQVFNYADLVEYHLQKRCGVQLQRALVLLIKAFMFLIIMNHWLACGFFAVHRYSERDQATTFMTMDGRATFDPETGRHDVCNTRISYCYARAVYFVMSTMSGVGYGDVQPFRNREFLFQWTVAIFGAYCCATVMGFLQTYFEDRDANGEASFKKKIGDLMKYVSFRQLEPSLKDAIQSHYTYIWRKMKSITTNRNEIVDSLSASLSMELSLHLQSSILSKVPLLAETGYPIKRRIALALKPQIALANSYLYKAGNVGYFVMFLSSGEVKVSLTADRSNLDSFGLAALKVLLHKQSVHGQTYLPGDHFGEYCLLSKSGLCPDNALAVTTSEIYTLSKEDLWAVFLYMTYADRRQFLLALMTRVGATTHLEHTLLPEEEIGGGDERIKNLYRTANRLLTEIVDYMDDDPVEDDVNRETLQLMHSEAMSQRDLMFLFDDIRTPSGSFTEKGSNSPRNSEKFRINRQRSTNGSTGGALFAATHRRSTLSNMPEDDEASGRHEDDISDENSSEAGTSSRRMSVSSRPGEDESLFSPAGVGIGAGAFSRDHMPSPSQTFRKQPSVGERRKALQLVQVSSQGIGGNLNDATGLDFAIGGALPTQRLGGGRQIAQITLSSLTGSNAADGSGTSPTDSNQSSRSSIVGVQRRRHSFGSIDLTNANRVRPDSTAADDNMVPSGRPRRPEQLNPNDAGAIDFQVFKNAREIEERILGRRPGSVERARKRNDSFH